MISFRQSSIAAMISLLFLLWAGQGLAQEKKIVLRVGNPFPLNHYMVRYGIKPWMENVTRATNGLVEFQHFPAEQLGKSKDLLALTLSGVADIGYVAPSYVAEKMPLSAVAELPGIFPTACVGTKAYWSLAKDGLLYQKELAPNGVRLIMSLTLPPYQLWTRKKFQTLKETEHLKIRTAGGAMDLTIRHMNSVPVRMGAPEIYESLSRGTLDGAIVPFVGVVAYKYHDVLKCVTIGQSLGSLVLTYVVSEKRWKTFPPTVQKAMLEVGEATTLRMCENIEKDEDSLIAQLKEQNFAMVRLSPEDDNRLQVQTGKVAMDWAKALDEKGKAGSEVLKAYQEAVQKVR